MKQSKTAVDAVAVAGIGASLLSEAFDEVAQFYDVVGIPLLVCVDELLHRGVAGHCSCAHLFRVLQKTAIRIDDVSCQAHLLHDPETGPVSVLPQLVLELRHI